MNSPLSNAVENVTREGAENIAGQISKRLDKALGALEEAVNNKLEEVIKKDMIDYYYGGYSPLVYSRTDILKDNLVKPIIFPFNNGNEKGFDFGIRYSPENMHHAKIRGPKSKKDSIPVNEDLIAQNFSEGIHPNGVLDGGTVNQGLIWAMSGDPSGSAADIMRQWSKENINKIFDDAVSDIMSKL